MTGAPSLSFTPSVAEEVKHHEKARTAYTEQRHNQDASADEKVRQILVQTALADLRATRAATLAYTQQNSTFTIPVASHAEAHILGELVENVRNQERAAVVEIIDSWYKLFPDTVDPQAVHELRMLIQRVRGPAWRQTRDTSAPGHLVGEEDFRPFRKTMAHSYKPGDTKLFVAE